MIAWLKQACRNIWWLLNMKPVQPFKHIDPGFYVDPKKLKPERPVYYRADHLE